MDRKVTIIIVIAAVAIAAVAAFAVMGGDGEADREEFKEASELAGGDYVEAEIFKAGESQGKGMSTLVEIIDDRSLKILTVFGDEFAMEIGTADDFIGMVYFLGDYFGDGTSTRTETIDTYLGERKCDVYDTTFDDGSPCTAWVDPDSMAVFKVSYVKDGVIIETVITGTSLIAGSEPGEVYELSDAVKPFGQLAVGDYMVITEIKGNMSEDHRVTVSAVDTAAKTITIQGYTDEDLVLDEADYLLFMSTDMEDKEKVDSVLIETDFGIREVDVYTDGVLYFYLGIDSGILYGKTFIGTDREYWMTGTSMFTE